MFSDEITHLSQIIETGVIIYIYVSKYNTLYHRSSVMVEHRRCNTANLARLCSSLVMLRTWTNKTTLYEQVPGKVAHRLPIIENTRLLSGCSEG